MKVVFMEEVEGTARVGEIKNVADGFARNYLLPRKLAAPATDHYVAIAQARAEKEARRQDRLDEEAQTHLVPKVEGRSIAIEVRVGEQGKLFGSVTARDIAEALQGVTGIELEHKQVDLKQPLRELGSYEVAVKLTRNVHVPVTVNVEPLGGMAEGEAAAEAPEAEAMAEEAVTEEPEVEAPEAEELEAEAAQEAEEAEEEAVGEEVAEAEVAEAEVEEEPEAEAAEEAEEVAAEEEVAEAEGEEEPEAEEAAEQEPEEESQETAAEQAEGQEPEAIEEPEAEEEEAQSEAVEGGEES